MDELVDDMLRLARLRQHPGRTAEPLDLTAVIAGCAERARIAAPERAWRVRVEAGLTRSATRTAPPRRRQPADERARAHTRQ